VGARWDLFVDWLDSQISVKPGLFYTDFRFLVSLKLWPLLAVVFRTSARPEHSRSGWHSRDDPIGLVHHSPSSAKEA
jgi:hypothetical protein